ncbi:mitochondrial carrier family [Plasmopara halstedii]|uniref:Mitochondrial carrier family n=1 Tax=Plasmopara halstedii TaxID=4781 RepID=A0A0P1AHN8_PLAHL|nr:mitochondrial carrier family [Plasmopara halstedii]CEG40471.1 mitochondrial carrier family [Plasmopara halstedii]|eukprot:XP_024576840.1 mitochondrial carrier family [Plasmopara halstedii]
MQHTPLVTMQKSNHHLLATSALKDAMGAEMKNRHVPVYVKMMAGMAGGVAEACILQPLDVTKTRLQLDRTSQYKGMVHCGSTIYKTEGGLALYKGLTPFVTNMVLKYALRFGSFAWFKEQIAGGKDKPITSTTNFTAGLLAGCIESVIIVTPFEVIKTRMQKEVGVGRFSGPIDCTHHIIRNEGVRALWKGNIPTMARQGSNQAFNFMAFAWLNHHVWDKQDGDGKTLPTYATVINGLIAGSLGPMCNTPMDVLKTRLMAQETVAGQEPKYKGFFDAMKVISREEGVMALWKGLLPRLTRMAPGQAITWSVVMRVTSIFENQELELGENKMKM